MKRLVTTLAISLIGAVSMLSFGVQSKDILIDLTQGTPNEAITSAIGDSIKI